MDLILEGLRQALDRILSLDPDLREAAFRTLQVSGTATLVSLLLGVPAGVGLALSRFRGRTLVVALVNTGMGLPPVVVGLFVMILLWRSGPLGRLGLLYTPTAMVVAQCLIAMPIVTGLSLSAVQSLPLRLRVQVKALGATELQSAWLLAREARLPLLAALMAGFGAVVSEVGASLVVGGNLKGSTRVLTTATVLEASKGNFAAALALGIVLLVLAYAINLVLTRLQQRART
ncbi:MAG: ABC transporter permease [Acidobacteriota bacterium]